MDIALFQAECFYCGIPAVCVAIATPFASQGQEQARMPLEALNVGTVDCTLTCPTCLFRIALTIEKPENSNQRAKVEWSTNTDSQGRTTYSFGDFLIAQAPALTLGNSFITSVFKTDPREVAGRVQHWDWVGTRRQEEVARHKQLAVVMAMCEDVHSQLGLS